MQQQQCDRKVLAIVQFTAGALARRNKLSPSFERLEAELDIQICAGERAHGVTHVVHAPDAPRTLYSLCAALRGKWLVSDKWLSDSLLAGQLLPEHFYGTRLASSPLAGRRVHCAHDLLHVGAASGFPQEHFATLLRFGGGELVDSALDADLQIVLDDSDATVTDIAELAPPGAVVAVPSANKKSKSRRSRRDRKAKSGDDTPAISVAALFDFIHPQKEMNI